MSDSKNNFTGWAEFPRPIVALAPMDGYTDSPFRRAVRLVNPGVVLFSEFTNADGFLRSDRLRRRLAFKPEEQPYFVQLFGNNPQTFAEAARRLEEDGVTGIDINMGCPAKKIVASQHGSGLMREVDLACRIVEGVRRACGLEVSVKTRLGWDSPDNLVPFATALEGAGASLITIHGRTYNQAFKGSADWEPIHRLKEVLRVPLLGNGDVADYTDGMRRLGNLDGVMIGRAAIGNPWVFLVDGRQTPPTGKEKMDLIIAHYRMTAEEMEPRRAIFGFRKHLALYLRGFENAKRLRAELLTIEEEAPLLAAIRGLDWEQSFPSAAHPMGLQPPTGDGTEAPPQPWEGSPGGLAPQPPRQSPTPWAG
ncbi:MAG: tRNA-dihydrouridine synthase [Deltaproteobacteria bacterium]|nr:tRNA-dihydrouridine synthase [Deltaproteobacteria bacterium]